MNRAYYSASIAKFLSDDPFRILGILTDSSEFEVDELTLSAWKTQIEILKLVLITIPGKVYFEFCIPRMGKRVDVLIFMSGIVFVIEFKVGETHYPSYAVDQVHDYALDLKNFHETSHQLPIVPVLISTQAPKTPWILQENSDNVYLPIKANPNNLLQVIQICLEKIPISIIDAHTWENGQYKPTPTIIEAAQALYRGHNVSEISRSDAGAINLSETSTCVDQIIETTKRRHQKAICFITGVPGSGKTLAGLNIANNHLDNSKDDHATFLSGNGPLVTVLREALVRDKIAQGSRRNEAFRDVRVFIQNIHQFRDEYAHNNIPPQDRVVIFDEAQRAWTQEQTSNFMRRKRGISDFKMSEPEFLISVMDRHIDWAVIICLIGGGQEIYNGEAGLSEWFVALNHHFKDRNVYISPEIGDYEYLQGNKPSELLIENPLYTEKRLHLAVAVRSYRSEKVSALVKSVLDCDLTGSQSLFRQISNDYPIVLTRDISIARKWLRKQGRGSERYGLVASSGALRMRPEGIFVKDKIDDNHWFLDDRSDVRSCFALEGVATEFDVQGLELDWIGVAWDADFSYRDGDWVYRKFKGSVWQNIKDPIRQRYLKNIYRVLLTRSRQGMIIFVPRGDSTDATRQPRFYDSTFDYLKQIGIGEIN